MAKLDDTFAQIENGFQSPATSLYKTLIEDKYMNQIGVRRTQTGLTHHPVWVMTVGEQGQPPVVTFYGRKPTECIKKALQWRGLPTASKGKNKGNGQPQAAA